MLDIPQSIAWLWREYNTIIAERDVRILLLSNFDSQAVGSVQDVEVIWGGAQAAQLVFIRNLYNAMVKLLNLGDWELGYRRLVQREDALSALLSMCGASGKVAPALAWAALLMAVRNGDGTLNYTRVAHVLSRLASKYGCSVQALSAVCISQSVFFSPCFGASLKWAFELCCKLLCERTNH